MEDEEGDSDGKCSSSEKLTVKCAPTPSLKSAEATKQHCWFSFVVVDTHLQNAHTIHPNPQNCDPHADTGVLHKGGRGSAKAGNRCCFQRDRSKHSAI